MNMKKIAETIIDTVCTVLISERSSSVRSYWEIVEGVQCRLIYTYDYEIDGVDTTIAFKDGQPIIATSIAIRAWADSKKVEIVKCTIQLSDESIDYEITL